jgi:hypothetical protein
MRPSRDQTKSQRPENAEKIQVITPKNVTSLLYLNQLPCSHSTTFGRQRSVLAYAGVVGCELSVGLDVAPVAIVFPRCDVPDQRRLVGNAAIETLDCENAKFELRHIEPTTVLWRAAPLEPLAQPSGFGGGKGCVKRRWRVRRVRSPSRDKPGQARRPGASEFSLPLAFG